MTTLGCLANRARERQRGQALVEWLIVSMLMLMAAVWTAAEFAREARLAAAKGHAQWLWTVGRAIEDVMTKPHLAPKAASHPLDGLRSNEVTPIEPWLDRLKLEGWLPKALARQPVMPYQVALLRLDRPQSCSHNPCTSVLLLLAIAKPNADVPDPSHLLSLFQGKGLAVTDLAPSQIRGAAYSLANPPVGTQPWPVGTLALLAWRHDHEPPYVRIDETRPITLAGGLVLGRHAASSGPCSPTGLVMLGSNGGLQVCRNGTWEAVNQPHDHLRACLPQTKEEAFRAMWLKATSYWAIRRLGVNCDCATGFAPIKAVGEGGHVGAVQLRDGYLCQRL